MFLMLCKGETMTENQEKIPKPLADLINSLRNITQMAGELSEMGGEWQWLALTIGNGCAATLHHANGGPGNQMLMAMAAEQAAAPPEEPSEPETLTADDVAPETPPVVGEPVETDELFDAKE